MMSFRTRERDLLGVFDRAFDAQAAAFAFCTHAFPSRPFSAFRISVFQPFSVSAVSGPWPRSPQSAAFQFLLSAFPISAFPLCSPVPGQWSVVCGLLSISAFCFPNFCFSPAPAVLWSMANSRWSPRPSRTLDVRLQTLDSFPSPSRLVCQSPERRRQPCQGESTSQPGRPLAELSILKGWHNPARG